ncbi:MAG: ZIP family metal transporter [Candidatus Promineifilaceae bacterium]|nr:ZIP family metal transporter [Candidatus Promineifilaceae bacterium]
MSIESNVLLVFILALITALATGLGAVPLLWAKQVPQKWLGLGSAFAGGLMLAASFNLIYEGFGRGSWRTIFGMLLGLGFIVLSHRWLTRRDVPDVADLPQADVIQMLLIVGVMTLHSFAEGVGVGVSFGGGREFGLLISIAIAVHNIPEGLAISLVLVPKGTSVGRAALWSVFSSLPQPLMAVPAFLFVEAFEPVLPVGLGLAAGAMIWMVSSEMIPEALKKSTTNATAIAATLAVVAMMAFQLALNG